MGDLTIILGIVAVICATLLLLAFLVIFCNNKKEIALKQAEENGKVLIEREKNERVLEVERMKLERAQLANEKSQLYVNRDIAQAQIEAGILGNQQEEDGFSGLIQQVLPILAQNPELLGKLSGFLGHGSPLSGGDAGTPAAFPAGTIPGASQ